MAQALGEALGCREKNHRKLGVKMKTVSLSRTVLELEVSSSSEVEFQPGDLKDPCKTQNRGFELKGKFLPASDTSFFPSNQSSQPLR